MIILINKIKFKTQITKLINKNKNYFKFKNLNYKATKIEISSIIVNKIFRNIKKKELEMI